MLKKSSLALYYITCPSKRVAQKLALFVLKRKVAACANIFTGVESAYCWNKKIAKSREVILLLKTKKTLGQKLCKLIEKNHPYETPCILEIPLSKVHSTYETWIKSVVNDTS